MKKFKKAYIEITNICNLSCAFCPKTKRKPQCMDIDHFTHVLHKLQGHTDHIYLHVLGEPLLHPKLDQILDICSQMKVKVNITTNGTLIGEVQELLLSKEAVRQINFSLHSFGANDQDEAMEAYIGKIIGFAKKAQASTNFYICLRLWNVQKGSFDHNKQILRMLEDAFSLDWKIEERLTLGNGITLGTRIFLQQDLQFTWPYVDAHVGACSGFCYGLRDQMAVLVDGTVVPCCLDGEGVISLGNLYECTLQEILEGKRARDLYEGFSNRNIVEPLCSNCGYRILQERK